MRGLGYIPSKAKGVQHECRNGIHMCALHHKAFDFYRFYIRWISEVTCRPLESVHIITFVDFQTNEFILINHSRSPAYENIHGNILHFNTTTKRCPFPTAFLWHECRVRGHHPTHGDRPVTVKRGVRCGGSCGGHVGVYGPSIGSTGGGEQVGGHAADIYIPHDAMSFIPMRLEGDKLAPWLQAARQHSSWKGCVVENTSWDGTAEENIEKYQREVTRSVV
jgi:hypothetical protein